MYRKFVLSKAKEPHPINAHSFNLLHGALGLSGEVMELELSQSRENTLEELGDAYFYFNLICSVFDIIPPDTLDKEDVPTEQHVTLHYLILTTEELVGLIKKHVIYQNPKQLEIELACANWAGALLCHCHFCNIALKEIINYNVSKLDKRYKDGFTSKEAELRQDKVRNPCS